MAECVSGDVTVLVMDAHEVEIVRLALIDLWESNDEFAYNATDYQRGVALSLMDAIGVD